MDRFGLAWMGWTWQTGLFFAGIAACLAVMTVLAIRFPERERVGVLAIATTRGDRLFLSLLGSAFIHLAWIGFTGGEHLYGASILSLIYAAGVFRWV
jgi:predicted small integral membrane protein